MKKIFSLVVALLTLVSCSEDFLNLTPQYYPNDATFFKTQEQFTQAVNGAYSALRGVSARQGYLMGETPPLRNISRSSPSSPKGQERT